MAEDDIRIRLLDAAAVVFAESGYEGARVADIAERAGLTTGAIYNRFSGKSELLIEAIDRHSIEMLDMLAETEMSSADILAALGAELVADTPDAEEALMFEGLLAARREPDLAERLGPRLADNRARLGKLVEADQVPDGAVDAALDVESIVTFCQAVGLGMGLLKVVGAGLPDPAQWQTLVTRLISALEPTTAEDANRLRAHDPHHKAGESTP